MGLWEHVFGFFGCWWHFQSLNIVGKHALCTSLFVLPTWAPLHSLPISSLFPFFTHFNKCICRSLNYFVLYMSLFREGCLEKFVQFHGEHLVSSPFDHQEAAPKSTKVTEETVEPKVEPKETKETETKVDDDAGVEDVNCYRLGLNFTPKNCTITCHVGKKMLSPTKKNDNQKRCTLLTLQLEYSFHVAWSIGPTMNNRFSIPTYEFPSTPSICILVDLLVCPSWNLSWFFRKLHL